MSAPKLKVIEKLPSPFSNDELVLTVCACVLFLEILTRALERVHVRKYVYRSAGLLPHSKY